MDTEEARRKADRQSVDRVLDEMTRSDETGSRDLLRVAKALLERERRDADLKFSTAVIKAEEVLKVREINANVIAENERVKKARNDAQMALDELRQAIFGVARDSGIELSHHDALATLRVFRTAFAEYRGWKESQAQRQASEMKGGVWSDSQGWVSSDTLRLKYPPRTLRCYSCRHELEFTSPSQANSHGWRGIGSSLSNESRAVCQKPRCQSIGITRLVSIEDFGWKSIHPVDALVELGAISSGSEFERDLRIMVESMTYRPIFVRKHFSNEEIATIAKAIEAWDRKMPIFGELPRIIAFDVEGIRPTRSVRFEPIDLKSALDKMGNDAAEFFGVQTTPPSGEAPVRRPHLNPLPHNRCECKAEAIRFIGVYRLPGERWPRCATCSKYIAQPKEATIRRMIFQIP